MQMQQASWKDQTREERGVMLAKSVNITKTKKGWIVPSQSGSGSYIVQIDGNHEPECNCLDCQFRKIKCKHIYAIEYYIKQEVDNAGNITVTKGVKVSYAQKWSAYNKSQLNEKLFFMRLLSDLSNNIEQPLYKFGRPTLPFSDMIFGSVMKVYTTFSLRRFMSDMKIAKEMGVIDKVPCYSSLSNFMNKQELTPILKELIKISASPLRTVEKDFAVDSSGFSTCRFARWFNYKYGKESKKRIWLKAHLISGVKSNIVTSAEITEGHSNDSKELSKLVKDTSKNFDMKEVSGDKAYCSRENFNAIAEVGAEPFIPFKRNITGRKPKYQIWRKMYHYFVYKNEEFMEHYHKRSNAETVFYMIKTKFRDDLRSKCKTAQINELLCKILANNICVVIQEMNELGVKGEFVVEEKIDVDS